MKIQIYQGEPNQNRWVLEPVKIDGQTETRFLFQEKVEEIRKWMLINGMYHVGWYETSIKFEFYFTTRPDTIYQYATMMKLVWG